MTSMTDNIEAVVLTTFFGTMTPLLFCIFIATVSFTAFGLSLMAYFLLTEHRFQEVSKRSLTFQCLFHFKRMTDHFELVICELFWEFLHYLKTCLFFVDGNDLELKMEFEEPNAEESSDSEDLSDFPLIDPRQRMRDTISYMKDVHGIGADVPRDAFSEGEEPPPFCTLDHLRYIRWKKQWAATGI